ncbi:MAG: HAD family hydrolase [Candidatus Jorgensenbacteria bacterium]|nr:HAD family hydrolase [Candidatus Jorgensenbacteria bacterium]
MKKFKVITFDLDGTLFDTMKLASNYLSEKFPGLTVERQKEMLAGNFLEELEKLEISKKQETDEERSRHRALYTEQKSNAPLFPGVKELLTELSHRYKLAVNTSAKRDNCVPLLEKSGIREYFSFIASKEEGKSKTEKFNHIAIHFDVPLSEVLFVTDTSGDLKEAGKVGVATIVVTWGVHEREYFLREEHKNLLAIVNTVQELEDILQNQF